VRKRIILGIFLFVGILVGTACGQSLNDQLFAAIKARNKAQVQTLLAGGASPNAKDGNGDSPLSQAAYYGPKDIVELLIEKGADINAKGYLGYTPLHDAASGAAYDVDARVIVELLIAKGADVGARNDSGGLPIDVAGQEGVRSVLRAAMGKNGGGPGNPALFAAIDQGNAAKVEELIGQGASLGGGDEYGYTPLIRAVTRGKKDIVELLIVHGADVNATVEWSTTALIEATCVNSNKKPIVEILIAHGADVNAKDKYGRSALDETVRCSYTDDLKDVAELLIAKGANVNARTECGNTPLDSAAYEGGTEAMELLIAHGADINAKGTKKGPGDVLCTDTPLGIAAYKSGKEQVELLISKGADVNATNNNGETPLQGMAHMTPGGVCLLPNYSTDQNCQITNKEIVALLQGQISKGLNPQDALKTYLAQFKGHSGNDDVRHSIIDLALSMRPVPAIPAEAEAAAGRGTYIFKNAKSPDEVLNAAKEYLAAIEAAPWVADYYYNLCIVLEKTPYSQQALHACKLYLVAAPDATDAGAVRQRIAGLQYAYDRDKAQMKQRTHYIKAANLEDLYRSGGISGKVADKDIVLKLFMDWTAAPPKYQIYVGCTAGGDIYGHTHDLVSTDDSMNFCKPVVNLHLVIKPEGEGFVEVSDSSGGSLRATLDELFIAKQKTMAQALLFSASGDQGDQYYVPYVQGGNDMQHVGFAMYESDCNGTILKKDPRALPDGFIPADKFAAGDYGRFRPEVDSFSAQPSSDVCTREFASKTGYHFGEVE